MPTPLNRAPIRIARGAYADLSASIADLQEGELCCATDENALYIVDTGALVKVGETIANYALDDLGDVDVDAVASPSNGRALVYRDSQWVAGPVVGGVPGVSYSIDTFDDVDTTTVTPVTGQTLVWDGAKWVPSGVMASASPPATVTSTGAAGEVRYDGSFVYVCTATNTWRRAAIATW